MSDRWYYQLRDEEIGPVESEIVLGLHVDGTLDSETLVRRDDDASWQPLRQSGLAAQLPSATDEAAELTDLNELTFEFEDNAAAPSATPRQAPEEVPDPQELADLSELSFQFEENAPDSPHRRRIPASRGETPDDSGPEEPLYWYQSLGATLGPVSLDELIQIAESGGLTDDDPVRCGHDSDWQTAADFDALQAAILSSRFAEDEVPQAEWMSAATSRRLGIDPNAPRGTPQPSSEATPETPAADASPAADARTESAGGSRKERPSTAKKPGRKRRSRRSQEDVIDNILDEVFSEEEPVPSPRSQSVAPSGDATSEPATAGTGGSLSPPAPMTPPTPPTPAAPSSFGSGSTSSSAAGLAAQYASSTRPQQSVPSWSSSGSRGSSFELSGGVIVTVLCLVLVVGVSTAFGMGWVALPQLSSSTPAEVKQLLQERFQAYRSLIETEPSEAAWKEFSDKHAPEITELFDDAREATGEAGRALQTALGDLSAILKSRLDDAERRGRLEKSFEENIAKAAF